MSAFAEATIGTERLLLTPLCVADADEMVDVLADPRLHEFIGGRPATLQELRTRYATLTGGSSRLDEVWRKWIIGVPWQHRDTPLKRCEHWSAGLLATTFTRSSPPSTPITWRRRSASDRGGNAA